ncbi:hypothetical protein [Bacillus phage BC-T25]|nr:hypothetical protein [Bacillus phage BC-T25]
MFVLAKWKRWCEDARKEIKQYRSSLEKEKKDNEYLREKIRDLELSFKRIHPRWGEYEYIEMAMDLFNKYASRCHQAGKLKDGRMCYWYYPEDGGGRDMRVVPCEELPNGYMRYIQKYEEPHRECVHCNKKFVLITGYPAKNARFCDEKCFNHNVWAQEDRREKEEWNEAEDLIRENQE